MSNYLTFPVEQDVPIPDRRVRRTKYGIQYNKYPWRDLGVGESFFVPCLPMHVRDTKKRIVNAWGKWKRKNPDMVQRDIVMCTETNGIRVWRER